MKIAPAVATIIAGMLGLFPGGPGIAQTGQTQPGQTGQEQAAAQGQNLPGAAVPLRTEDLRRFRVVSPQGEEMAGLREIVVLPSTGRIIYGVVDYGGFLGIGDRLLAVPWEAFQVQPENRALVLNMTKEMLQTAPGFSTEDWPEFHNEQWARSVYAFFGQTPYWEERASR